MDDAATPLPSSSASSESAGEDTWSDFGDDGAVSAMSLVQPIQSFRSPIEALEHDRLVHGLDFVKIVQNLHLNALDIIRFINWIRKDEMKGRTMEEILAVDSRHVLFSDEQLLQSTMDNDGMLQYDFETEDDRGSETLDDLKAQLADARDQLHQLKSIATCHFRKEHGPDVSIQRSTSSEQTLFSKQRRDDDTHYFRSYAYNEIHSAMLRDTIRTNSYRHFLLSNPQLIKGKRVLDLGCGTGILSFFAAQAGAAQVYAVDASDIARHTLQHVADNDLGHIVKVIHKKSEHVSVEHDLDGERLDVIVSEWMGYALLYEGFLPSVLEARDKLLKPIAREGSHGGGIMAPSQCSILLSIWGDEEWYRDKISWWNDVYGFNLSSMTEDIYSEAMIDTFDANGMIADPVVLHDIHTSTLKNSDTTTNSKAVGNQKQQTSTCMNIVESTFEFTCRPSSSSTTTQQQQQPSIKAGFARLDGFLLWFDTFFTTDHRPVNGLALQSTVPSQTTTLTTTTTTNWMTSPGEIAFSTGPHSPDTHWHQTLFVLKTPSIVPSGTIVRGNFSFKVSPENSRELDCTIQWTTQEPSGVISPPNVQFWKVR